MSNTAPDKKQRQALIEKRLRALQTEAPAPNRIQRRSPGSEIPLSASQRRLWILDQLLPGSPASNRPLARRLRGPLNRPALERALNELLNRHESLRTVFPAGAGDLYQVVLPPGPLQLDFIDLRSQPDTARDNEARRIATEEANRNFDLSRGPLFRAVLLRLAEHDHVLLLLMHHIVFDGWSETILEEEIKRLYAAFARGEQSPLDDLPIQYGDFACWQETQLSGDHIQFQLAYWRKQLAGMPPALPLPTDNPRTDEGGNARGGRCRHSLPASLTGSLKALGREEQVTLFMSLAAAFQLLLARHSGQEDIVICVPTAGRNQVETEKLIGCLINLSVLRTSLSGEPSFRELLGRVRKVVLGALAHQDVPFERIVEAVQPERRLGRWPLFQVMFQLRNLPRAGSSRAAGLEFVSFPFDTGLIGGLDLSLEMQEADGQLHCSLRYDSSLFHAETAELMLARFDRLLHEAVAAPNRPVWELPFLAPAEEKLLARWNDTSAAFAPGRSIHDLFEEQAAKTPDAIAIVAETGQLTYRELNGRANQLARYLRERGAGEDTPVAVCADRSLELIVGVLGILKAGAAYVPLDPAHPPERRAALLRDVNAAILLTQDCLAGQFPAVKHLFRLDTDWPAVAESDDSNPNYRVPAGSLAYIIHTSGSTGTPKGVMVPHSAVCNHLFWRRTYFPIDARDRVIQRASIAFDDSVWELFESLTSGSTLVLAKPGGESDLGYLIDIIQQQHISVACLIPSQLAQFVEEPRAARCVSLRRVTTGAEVLPPAVVRRFFEILDARLYNGYGPTEATIAATFHECKPGSSVRNVPIGRPVANTTIHILDRHAQPVPIGVPGELHIGGAGLARGYHHQPELTARSFIPSPFDPAAGARIYRTGDRARWLRDGNLEFLGRADQQVKLRGHRIELGEIEAVLEEHPEVRQAVVALWEPSPGDRTLAAYIVPEDSAPPLEEQLVAVLRAFLRSRLPVYMLPAGWSVLDAMPRAASGKVDRAALPEPRRHDASCQDRTAPGNKIESQLKAIWEDAFQIRGIGLRQGFFELGGHSLLAVKVLGEIERQCNVRLPIASLIESPTIEKLACLIASEGSPEVWSPLVPIQRGGARLPLFCLHANNGNVLFYRELAECLGPSQPVYGVQSPALRGDSTDIPETIEQFARLYIAEIRTVQPHGPYYLAGFCMGAYIAHEIAVQFQAAGESVAFLGNINTHGSWKLVDSFRASLRYHWTHWRNLSAGERLDYVNMRTRQRIQRIAEAGLYLLHRARVLHGGRIPNGLLPTRVLGAHLRASARYTPSVFRGKVHFFQGAGETWKDYRPFWTRAIDGEIEEHVVPGKYISVLQGPNARILARELRAAVEQAALAPSRVEAVRIDPPPAVSPRPAPVSSGRR